MQRQTVGSGSFRLLTPGEEFPRLTGPETGRLWSGSSRAFEFRLWTLLLFLTNLPLLKGNIATVLAFFPAEVAAGQWWRLLTFPFVHASLYHLILDAAAFLLLWQALAEERAARRFGYFAACWAGSLLLALTLAPEVQTLGLCGLSGIAHGLLAVVALELLTRSRRRSRNRHAGALLLAGVVGKCALEVATGGALFASLHLGEVGQPVVATHAGGVLGGVVAFGLLQGRGWIGIMKACRQKRSR